jgi:hypothetical protein
MSSENTAPKSETPREAEGSKGKKSSTFVDALFDIGLSWADFGVGQGKRALEQSAKTLEKAAQSLSDLQERLRKAHAS